jgi:hypothetical protein
MDLTTTLLDRVAVALDHARYLLALVRMDHKYDFVMTHYSFLLVRIASYQLSRTNVEARNTFNKVKIWLI